MVQGVKQETYASLKTGDIFVPITPAGLKSRLYKKTERGPRLIYHLSSFSTLTEELEPDPPISDDQLVQVIEIPENFGF